MQSVISVRVQNTSLTPKETLHPQSICFLFPLFPEPQANSSSEQAVITFYVSRFLVLDVSYEWNCIIYSLLYRIVYLYLLYYMYCIISRLYIGSFAQHDVLKFIHVLSCVYVPFLLMVYQYFICVSKLFILLSVDEYLSCWSIHLLMDRAWCPVCQPGFWRAPPTLPRASPATQASKFWGFCSGSSGPWTSPRKLLRTRQWDEDFCRGPLYHW